MLLHLLLRVERVDPTESTEPFEHTTVILIQVVLHSLPGSKLLRTSPTPAVMIWARLADVSSQIRLDPDRELPPAGATVNDRHWVSVSVGPVQMISGQVALVGGRRLESHASERFAFSLTEGTVVGEHTLRVNMSLESTAFRLVSLKSTFGRSLKLKATDADKSSVTVTIDIVAPPVLSIALDLEKENKMNVNVIIFLNS